MSEEIKIVYQDCPDCPPYDEWMAKQREIAAKKKFEIVKVSFVKKEAAELMKKAVKAGIVSMPFFTDGEIFSKNISDFVKKPAKKTKTQKRIEKAIKEDKDNGVDSEL